MSENKASGGNAFSSLMGFLMTAIGFAVGVGSIWRFPYLLGTNGGALFLIVYVLIIVVIGIPLLTAETAMGFKTQKTAVLAYRALAPQHKIWSYAGYAHLLAALLIVSYTIPIYAWILGYLYNTAIGTFHGMDMAQLGTFFGELSGNYPLVALFATINLAFAVLVVSGGVAKGVETLTKILLPVLGVIMVILIIAGLRMPGAEAGLSFLFKPNAEAFTLKSLQDCLGQAFFAVGIGMLASMVFGSYIKNPKQNLGKTSIIISVALIAAGVMAGMMIFPALFSAGYEPQSSVGLVFLTVPLVFDSMPLGCLMGTLFFFGFYIAAVTSSAGVMEAVVGMLMDQFKLTRKKALLFTVLFQIVIGIFCLDAGSFFNFCDILTNNYILTLGALVIAIFVGWIWGADNFVDAANVHGKFTRLWLKVSVKYISPIVILVIFITSIF